MRKLISLIVLVGITILMLMPVQPVQPVEPVQAMSFYEEHYTVYYDCVVGPWPGVVGQWTRDCNGNMTGWGWEPGHQCTDTETSFGNECVP